MTVGILPKQCREVPAVMEMIDKWDLAESQQTLEQGEVGDTVLGNCFGPCWWLGTEGSEIKSLIYFQFALPMMQ